MEKKKAKNSEVNVTQKIIMRVAEKMGVDEESVDLKMFVLDADDMFRWATIEFGILFNRRELVELSTLEKFIDFIKVQIKKARAHSLVS